MNSGEIFHVIWLSAVSVLFLFVLTKIMGNKQISQMNMFDYIIGISVGSISAEMAVETDDSVVKPLVAMTVYALISIVFAVLTNKSVFFRKIITGRTILLFEDGMFYRDNFKKARMDINDFLSMLRVKGFFDISQLQNVILEPNGTLSVLQKSEFRPMVPSDNNLVPVAEKIIPCVILDGHIMSENLKLSGKNDDWLMKKLREQKISDLSEVFLATISENSLSVYKTVKKSKNLNLFD